MNPRPLPPGQTTRGARLLPAYALVRPTFSVAESWYDSLQASLRMRPTHGLNFLASYTLGHAVDHVSGLNIGGESRPVLPVGMGDDASIDAALEREKGDALFDVRHRFVFSFGDELPRLDEQGAAARHIARRLAAERDLPGADRVPVHRHRRDRRLDIHVHDQPAEHDLRSERGRRRSTTDAVVQHRAASSADARGKPAGGRQRRAQRGARPGLPAHRPVALQELRVAGRHRMQLRVEAFNVLQPGAFRPAGRTAGAATFGRITQAEDGRIVQLGIKYRSRRLRG